MRIALAVLCGGVTFLSGCASSQVQLPAATGAVATPSQVPRGEQHFMKALFYAFGGSDGKMAIFKVTYAAWPELSKLVSIPYVHLYGACSDPSGHVFVTQHNTSGSGEVIEFAHGGTDAIATLSDTGMATACAYDRSTGNLAVANSYDADAPGGPGPDIAVYADETGKPMLYADSLSNSIRSCTYDPSGNLFVGGVVPHGHFALTELPRGSNAVKAVAIDGKIGAEYRNEDVQWHHGSLFITSTDQHRDHGTHVLVLSIRGSTATIKGTITLHTVNRKEKATGPWTVLFGRYAITTDRVGVAAWKIPMDCTGACRVGKGERHLLRIAEGFVSVVASAIRPDEGKI